MPYSRSHVRTASRPTTPRRNAHWPHLRPPQSPTHLPRVQCRAHRVASLAALSPTDPQTQYVADSTGAPVNHPTVGTSISAPVAIDLVTLSSTARERVKVVQARSLCKRATYLYPLSDRSHQVALSTALRPTHPMSELTIITTKIIISAIVWPPTLISTPINHVAYSAARGSPWVNFNHSTIGHNHLSLTCRSVAAG